MLQKVGCNRLAVSLRWEYPPKGEFHSFDLPSGAITLFSSLTFFPLCRSVLPLPAWLAPGTLATCEGMAQSSARPCQSCRSLAPLWTLRGNDENKGGLSEGMTTELYWITHTEASSLSECQPWRARSIKGRSKGWS